MDKKHPEAFKSEFPTVQKTTISTELEAKIVKETVSLPEQYRRFEVVFSKTDIPLPEHRGRLDHEIKLMENFKPKKGRSSTSSSMKTWHVEKSDCRYLPKQPRFSLSPRRTARNDSYKTTGILIVIRWSTRTHYPISRCYWMISLCHLTSPSLMYTGDSPISVSRLEMNGKWRSSRQEEFSNLLSCSLDRLTRLPHSSIT